MDNVLVIWDIHNNKYIDHYNLDEEIKVFSSTIPYKIITVTWYRSQMDYVDMRKNQTGKTIKYILLPFGIDLIIGLFSMKKTGFRYKLTYV